MHQNSISLCGDWDVHIDFGHPANDADTARKRDHWRSIQVPGCWEQAEENKLADGPVWYRKTFTVPEDWKDQPAALQFDGVNYYCDIYLNGAPAGTHEGGWSGFRLRAEHLLNIGCDNELLVKVYKQGGLFPLRESLAGFLPDVGVIHGGIWKPVVLQLLPEVEVQEAFVKPRISEAGIEVEYRLHWSAAAGPQEVALPVRLLMEVRDPLGRVVGDLEVSHARPAPEQFIEGTQFLRLEGSFHLWSPDSPVLYNIELKAVIGDTVVHSLTTRFGMKQVEIRGDEIYLNGKPIYLRGVLHWGWYGDHIAPIPSKEEIRAELTRVKESGFNLVKHCLYVPIRDYYELADEMGVLLWQELPMWLPTVTSEFKQRVFTQYEDIIREARNHASLIIWTLGCELDQSADSTFLHELYDMAKRLTDGAVIRDNSGSGECYGGLLKENADFYDYHFYTDIHFYSDLLSQFAGSWRENKPWLFGEFCDYDEFRDVDRTIAANGGRLPWWLNSDPNVNPVARDTRFQYSRQQEKLAALGLPFTNDHLWQNANKSAYVYRKAVLELVRTYQKIAGYVITSIKDNPIASSAVFDDQGFPKQAPERFRRYNESTVIALTYDHRRSWVNGGDRLIRWDPYNYTAGEFIRPHIFVSHYDGSSVTNGNLLWRMSSEGADMTPFAQGRMDAIRLKSGDAKEVGVVEIKAPQVNESTWVMFAAELSWEDERGHKQIVSNEWSMCVFPLPSLSKEEQASILIDDPLCLFAGLDRVYPEMQKALPCRPSFDGLSVIVTSLLRDEHKAFMESGGKVLYVQRGHNGTFDVRPMPFWRESLQLYHAHPVMEAYPHQNHTSLSMFGIATDTVFDREKLPAHESVMERLDARTFDLNSYMFESKVGLGKMIATTFRLEGGLGSQPTGIAYNPGGRYLLETIIKYLMK